MKVKIEEKFDIEEFETKLHLLLEDDNLENRKFIHSFLAEKRKETNFNELESYYNKVKMGVILGGIIIVAAITFLLISNMGKGNGPGISGGGITSPDSSKPILKATYHIAYFEDIDIVDRLSTELNLKENEYAKFIFYKSDGDEEILVRKDSLSKRPDYKEVLFKKLTYIFPNLINSFIKDTNSNKNLVILGNMPKTPSDIKKREERLSLITIEQFDSLKINNNEVLIFLKSDSTEETQKLVERFKKHDVKYKIFK